MSFVRARFGATWQPATPFVSPSSSEAINVVRDNDRTFVSLDMNLSCVLYDFAET